jgi:hypothetical protein
MHEGNEETAKNKQMLDHPILFYNSILTLKYEKYHWMIP